MPIQFVTTLEAAAKLFSASFRHPNTDKNVVFYDHTVDVVDANTGASQTRSADSTP